MPTKPEKPKAAPEADEEAGPSFIDTLADNWKALVGGFLLLVLGAFAFNFVRRRREDNAEGALRGFDVPPSAPIPTETMRLRALRGTVFIPFHYAKAAANRLTHAALDPISGIPELKVCAVKLSAKAA